ncbi:Ig-like domain-containing protein [Dictyoglomus thermophilum]|uniref:Fibronectin type III domain protein n=1 Tax=Dictyoglomus thermophilum (strain ATCC 35947 / DSM 3960 / H-6-12) TaxID=309799 RepID=B5YBM9_DICT6|nr:Ig-like domain-containing protein [Dictyoglomus thermophilum]ACI19633.1 fibronectin type III domain protein [Dictyoglomus thermophilum H-6-12]
MAILDLQDGSKVSGEVLVKVNASDNVGVTKVEIYIDQNMIKEFSQALYEYAWDTKDLTYGSTHTLKAMAYDKTGNVGETLKITVVIGDNQVPQVTITSPQNEDLVDNITTIVVQVVEKSPKIKVNKTPSSVSKVEFYVDDQIIGTKTEGINGTYICSWNTQSFETENHTITVRAYNAEGNIGSASINVGKNTFLKWKYSAGYVYACPSIGDDGTIYIVANGLYALNPNGSVKWQKQGDGFISMTEAYEWVAVKSQAYNPPKYPLFDDNGDKVGSSYRTSEIWVQKDGKTLINGAQNNAPDGFDLCLLDDSGKTVRGVWVLWMALFQAQEMALREK